MRTAQVLSVFALLMGSGLATPVPASGAYDGANSMLRPVSAAAADFDDFEDTPMPVSAASAAANTRTAAFSAAADDDETDSVPMPVSAAASLGTQGLRGNSRAAAAAAAEEDLAATGGSSKSLKAAAAAPAAKAAGDIPIPQGFKKLVFEDNFAKQKAGALPDQGKWLIDLGTQYPGGAANWGTQEIQTYTNNPANLAIKNNALTITPVKNGNAWTSARIETKAGSDVQCPPGGKLRVEASLKLPASDPATQLGIWPAFWMLGQGFRTDRNSWPKVAEIDILEVSNGVGTVFHTAHCGIINGGPCKEKTGLGGSGQFPRGKFVKVAVTIDRTNKGGDFKQEKLEWSVDGKVTHTLTGAEVKDADAWENLARTPKMILLNVAIGGEFPDAKAGTKTPTAKTVGGEPSAMEVQYVAAFTT
ncbi:hypothetical protein PspLS_11257 [Pyricularia sp. CBS 133598]|nr:hypothetical protein PspLS_11257 [Pyricularia sp. CBS 133598]